jgi:hypothetical protein
MNKEFKIAVFLAFTSLFIGIISYFVYQIHTETLDLNLIFREIESKDKLWLNGYLGFFFRFSYFGNLNWLIIIPFIGFLFNIKNQNHATKTWVITFIICLMIILSQGFFNARYGQTLMMISTIIIVLYFSKYLEGNSKLIIGTSIWIILMLMLNNWLARKNKVEIYALADKKMKLSEEISHNKFSKKVERFIHYYWNSFQFRINLKRDSRLSKTRLYSVIDSLPNENFLVNNLPAFYYFTSKKGYYYWSGDDFYYDKKGNQYLFKNRSLEQVYTYLNDSLQCQHIITSPFYTAHNDSFQRFIKTYCEIIYHDEYDYQIATLKKP